MSRFAEIPLVSTTSTRRLDWTKHSCRVGSSGAKQCQLELSFQLLSHISMTNLHLNGWLVNVYMLFGVEKGSLQSDVVFHVPDVAAQLFIPRLTSGAKDLSGFSL
jgi:hypothetical protein